MKFRKLWVAWSVFFGAICLLLTIAWIRSHYRWDSPNGPLVGKYWVQLNSIDGHLFVGVHVRDSPNRFIDWNWRTLQKSRLTDSGVAGLWEFAWKLDALAFGAVETKAARTGFMRYWFLILTTGTIATIPWLEYPWRFRLRTLLIWMSLVAILLGMDSMLKTI